MRAIGVLDEGRHPDRFLDVGYEFRYWLFRSKINRRDAETRREERGKGKGEGRKDGNDSMVQGRWRVLGRSQKPTAKHPRIPFPLSPFPFPLSPFALPPLLPTPHSPLPTPPSRLLGCHPGFGALFKPGDDLGDFQVGDRTSLSFSHQF